MAAAALGNTVSDLAGIGSAWYVENIAVKIGIKAPELSPEQLEGMGARWSANMVSFWNVLYCLVTHIMYLIEPDCTAHSFLQSPLNRLCFAL